MAKAKQPNDLPKEGKYRFHCLNCDHEFILDRYKLGDTVKCGHCGHQWIPGNVTDLDTTDEVLDAAFGEIDQDELRAMNIYQRIAAISADLRYITKGSTIKGKSKGGGEFQYKGISHDDVVNALQPLFERFHIHAFPTMGNHERDGQLTIVTIQVTFRCLDEPAQAGEDVGVCHSTVAIGYGQDFGDKGIGKAYSYGMKYALLKTFFLETGEDDEQRAVEPESIFLTATQYRDLVFTLVDNDVDEELFVEALKARVLKEGLLDDDLTNIPLRYFEGCMAILRSHIAKRGTANADD